MKHLFSKISVLNTDIIITIYWTECQYSCQYFINTKEDDKSIHVESLKINAFVMCDMHMNRCLMILSNTVYWETSW